MTTYTITLLPAVRPDETEWTVKGGTEPYTVRRNKRGEFRCTCPAFTKCRSGQRDLVRRNGCKHVHKVLCFLGEHKFMPTLRGPECVRCGLSEAEYEFHEYGPPDPELVADRRDY